MSHWMHHLAQRLTQGADQVLVTVARADGSTPRDAGTVMLISATDTHDTIGGGHLEWEAIKVGRELLVDGPAPTLLRFSLGAKLGQCCGGAAWLVLERICASDAAAWQQRALALREGCVVSRQLTSRNEASLWHTASLADQTASTRLEGDLKAWSLVQAWLPYPFTVVLFGAGHVGAALVHVLAPLGVKLIWVDEREELFGDVGAWPDNVQCLATDTPAAEIAAAPTGSCFLLMTHNHALDFELCQAIFKRDDFDYFGMIGSHSKRATFEHRLRDRGVPVTRFKEMICPIGVPGVTAKEPAAIAIVVAAQLLQVRERRQVLGRRLAHTSNDHTLVDPPPSLAPEKV